MWKVIIAAVLLPGLCAGIAALQIFLSKKESKWAGLILPIVSFCFSLAALFAVVLFTAYTGTTTLMHDGQIVEQAASRMNYASSLVGLSVYIFMLFNIPTAILLAIYAAFRGKRKKQSDLEKMSVQDLE